MDRRRDAATYTYGDDAAAAARLALVADAYAPRSRAFLARHVPRVGAGPGRPLGVLDLGCGPGFSTALLHDVIKPGRLTGLDSSPAFLDVARSRVPSAQFAVHDVVTMPLPAAPAGVIYARLVLSHLADPLATVHGWTGQLAPGGVLLVEDLEEVVSPPGALREYERVSATVVRAGGGVLYAGPALAQEGGRCVAVTVPASQAAVIYLVNVRRWLAEPSVPVEPERLRALESRLDALVGEDSGHTVSWIVRQLALRA